MTGFCLFLFTPAGNMLLARHHMSFSDINVKDNINQVSNSVQTSDRLYMRVFDL